MFYRVALEFLWLVVAFQGLRPKNLVFQIWNTGIFDPNPRFLIEMLGFLFEILGFFYFSVWNTRYFKNMVAILFHIYFIIRKDYTNFIIRKDYTNLRGQSFQWWLYFKKNFTVYISSYVCKNCCLRCPVCVFFYLSTRLGLTWS